MKSIFIILIMCLATFKVDAQNEPKAKAFINEVTIIATTPGSLKDVYLDSIYSQLILNIYRDLATNTNGAFYVPRTDSMAVITGSEKSIVAAKEVYNKLSGKNGRIEMLAADSLVLTEKEIAYLYEKTGKMKTHTWKPGLFANMDLLTKDSLDKLKEPWKFYMDSGKIYQFSIPVFLRDDSYCFFYQGYGCGILCGQGDYSIYKKINGKWVKWITLSSWMS